MEFLFDKKKIADNATFFAYYLILTSLFLSVLAIADVLFNWDIFPWAAQQILLLLLWVTILSIIGAFLINLMVNLSRIADGIEAQNPNQNPADHD